MSRKLKDISLNNFHNYIYISFIILLYICFFFTLKVSYLHLCSASTRSNLINRDNHYNKAPIKNRVAYMQINIVC